MLYKEHGNEKANIERGKVNKLLQSIQKRKHHRNEPLNISGNNDTY